MCLCRGTVVRGQGSSEGTFSSVNLWKGPEAAGLSAQIPDLRRGGCGLRHTDGLRTEEAMALSTSSGPATALGGGGLCSKGASDSWTAHHILPLWVSAGESLSPPPFP